MERFVLDLRFGMRLLRRNPGFTAVAVLALGIGIGGNTAIFSAVNGILLRPLPYPHPEQLAMVWVDNQRQGIAEDITSYPNYVDWRDQNKVFHGMAAYTSWRAILTGKGEPEQLVGAIATATFFDVLGVSPALGRSFTKEEEQEGKDQVVILSHGLWQRRFGGERSILGRSLTLSGRPYTVTGVMPPGFQFPTRAEMWAPLAPSARMREARNAFWLPVIGRLKAGVSRVQAQADMDVIAQRIVKAFPRQEGYGINVVPLHEQIVGQVRPALLVLLGAVGFVLLIACTNVANLLLARAVEREREIALRTALGAGRARIFTQVLTESMLLAGFGGIVGLALGLWGVQLVAAVPSADIPRLEQIRVDASVLGFTFLAVVATGLFFGAVPASGASRIDLIETLKEGGRGASSLRGLRARRVLVVAETALALVLLVGAGLLMRSFSVLLKVDPGFNPSSVLVAEVSLPRTRYAEGAQVRQFYSQLEERLSALPGIRSVGSTTGIFLPKLANSGSFSIEGRPTEPEGQRLELPFDFVTPNYFRTLGIPLLRGRLFDHRDTRDATQVAIVNETMVRRYWPDQDPIGKRFKFGNPEGDAPWITVVGMVKDSRRQGLDAPIRIEAFMPHTQSGARSLQVVMKTDSDPISYSGSFRETLRGLDAEIPIASLRTLDGILDQSLAQRRLNMLLIGLFAAAALILSAVGIYGVISYAVVQRTREIGIRMALGAGQSDVLRLVVAEGMYLVLAGILIGSAGALALTRLMATLLFGVTPADPVTYAGTAGVLCLVALASAYIPARRASRIDPIAALRYE